MLAQVQRFCFPDMSLEVLSNYKWLLLKYRNFYPPGKMRSSEFLYFVKKLERDINDKELDPYKYKYSITPQRQN